MTTVASQLKFVKVTSHCSIYIGIYVTRFAAFRIIVSYLSYDIIIIVRALASGWGPNFCRGGVS